MVARGRDGHEVAWAGEFLVGFGAALADAGFAAAGAEGEEVGGAKFEHGFGGVLAGAGTGLGGDGVLPVAEGIQRAFEAELVEGRALLGGALEHDAAKEVVGDGVEEQFAADHGGAEAAHGGGLEGGLEVVKVEFDAPAAFVEGEEGFHGPEHRVEQGGQEQEFAGAKAGPVAADAHLPHGDGLGQPLPEAGAQDAAGVFVRRAAHGDEAVVRAEPPTFAPVDPCGVAPAHEEIGPAHGQEGEVGKAPKAPVADEEVTRAQGAAQERKKPGFARAPFTVGGTQEGSAAQTKDAGQVDERPATAGFLGFGLGPFPLVRVGVGGGDGGGIHHEDAPPMAAGEHRRVRREPVGGPPTKAAQPLQRQTGAGRAKGAAARVAPGALPRLPPGLDGTLALAARGAGVEDQVQAGPKDQRERQPAQAFAGKRRQFAEHLAGQPRGGKAFEMMQVFGFRQPLPSRSHGGKLRTKGRKVGLTR